MPHRPCTKAGRTRINHRLITRHHTSVPQLGCGLSRAVRPEETEDLAVADLEADVVERDPVTEALGQMMDRERRGAPCRGVLAVHDAAFPGLVGSPTARLWLARVRVRRRPAVGSGAC